LIYNPKDDIVNEQTLEDGSSERSAAEIPAGEAWKFETTSLKDRSLPAGEAWKFETTSLKDRSPLAVEA